MYRHPKFRALRRATGLVGVAMILSTTAVFADTANADADTAKSGNNITYLDSASPGAEACSTRGTPVAGLVTVSRQGTTHLTAGASVTISVTPTAGAAAQGISGTGSTATVPTGTAWDSTGGPAFDTFAAAISTTTPNSAANGTYTMNFSVAGPGSGPGAVAGVVTITNTYTVTVTCTAVVNAAPTVLIHAVDAYGSEGDLLSASGSFSDPDSDALTLTADNTDGTFTDNLDGTWSWSYQTTEPVPVGVIVVTADDGNGHLANDSFHYGATNVEPTVAFSDPATTADEGDTVTFDFTITDPGTTETYVFVSGYPNCGSGNSSSNESITGKTGSFDCTFVDGLNPAIASDVKVAVSDGTDDSDEASAGVTVSNVAPSVDTPAFSPASINCGQSASLTNIGFSDPGLLDNDWGLDIDWGDSSTHYTDTLGSQGPYSASPSHPYANPGAYTATVKETDKDGYFGTSTAGLTVNQTYTVSFLQPLDQSSPSQLIANSLKNGRVVPVKATIKDDCTGAWVTGTTGQAVTIKVNAATFTVSPGAVDAVEAYSDAGASSANTTAFRWVADSTATGGGYWIYNLDTSGKGFGFSVGTTYQVRVVVNGLCVSTKYAVLQPTK